MLRTAMALLAALAAAGCGEPGLMPRAVAETAEEDAIYLAALEAMYRDEPLVVAPRTMPASPPLVDDMVRAWRGRPAPVDAALAADHVARSGEERVLRGEAFAARRGAAVAPRAALDSLRAHGAGYWEAFHARFPGAGGLVSLSRAGFTPDRTKALVVVHRVCGTLCGRGGVVLLAKRDGRWVVDDVPVVIRN